MTGSNIVVAIAAVFIFLLVIYVFWKILIKDIYYNICRMTRGVVVHADITYLLDTLVKVQYRPMYIVQLRFYIADAEVITDQVKVLLSKKQAAQYTVGTKVKIKYDPRNINNLAIIAD